MPSAGQPIDFIEWVVQHPLLATEPVRPVVVGSYPGVAVDIAIKRPKTATDCPEDGRTTRARPPDPLVPGFRARLPVVQR